MMSRVRLVILIVVLATGVESAAAAVQQAFLVQNSGWMEPFYVDSSSPFKQLIEAVVNAAAGPDESVTVSAFNQSVGNNQSPLIAYQGKPGPQLNSALRQIVLARKGSGRALADTDFREAVIKTVTGVFGGKSGVIWIFTNNKNSPNNSAETAARNREFYELLHLDPSITRTLAYPLSMPVKGSLFQATGLMIYALAYGPDADPFLQAVAASGRFKKVLTDLPARLKPLDRDAVRLVPKRVLNAPNTRASLAQDGRTVLLDIDVSSRQSVVDIVATLENQFFPYLIERATVSAQISGNGWSRPLAVKPDVISRLPPNTEAEVAIALPIAVELPSAWSPKVLSEMGKRVSIPAVVEITLNGQSLGIDQSFRSRLKKIFPGDPLSEVFVPPAAIKSSTAAIPMVMRVNYPLYPLILVMFACLLLLLALLFLAALVKSEKRYKLAVDGQPRSLVIKAFSSADVFLADGKSLAGIVRRGVGQLHVKSVSKGHTITILK